MCCGAGVVQIKCPYSCKDKSFLQVTSESTFFLNRTDGDVITLKTNHAYFYQVQAQMKFCGATYCDFVVRRGGTNDPKNIPR